LNKAFLFVFKAFSEGGSPRKVPRARRSASAAPQCAPWLQCASSGAACPAPVGRRRAGRISATPREDLRPRKFKKSNFTALFFRPQRAGNDIFRHYLKKVVRAHQAQN